LPLPVVSYANPKPAAQQCSRKGSISARDVVRLQRQEEH
jgi:hypothetical protein